MVVPIANLLPESGVLTTATGWPARFVADTANSTIAPSGPVASARTLIGTMSVGGVLADATCSANPAPVLFWTTSVIGTSPAAADCKAVATVPWDAVLT